MIAALGAITGGLTLFGLPLFALFAALTILYTLALNQDFGLIATNLYYQLTRSPTIYTIPLFTFAGYLMAESKTGDRLVRFFGAWFGWMPGGLAVVCLAVCAFFTTFTGASGVTIIAIGGLLYPVLLKQRYPERFSLGLVAASGSLGLLFPPSLPLIVYGMISGADIQKMFVAGIIPGLLMIGILALYAMYVAKRAKVERQPFRWSEAWRSLRGAIWEAILPFVIFGLMYSKIISVNEIAVVAVAYVFIIECFVYKDVSIVRDLPRILRESMVMVGAILVILAVAIPFTDSLVFDKIPDKIFDFVNTYITSDWAFLLILNGLLIVVGCLLDIFSAIIVVVPLLIPIAKKFGIDPTHLGIIFLVNLEIGYLHPPVGINLFLASLRFKKSMVELFRVAIPFILLLFVALGLITYVKPLSLWLPEVLGMEAKAEIIEKDMEKRAAEEEAEDAAEEARAAKGADGGAPAVKAAPGTSADEESDGLDDPEDDAKKPKAAAPPDGGLAPPKAVAPKPAKSTPDGGGKAGKKGEDEEELE
jgi:tripartite ATP-independent transporter DctM subunit